MNRRFTIMIIAGISATSFSVLLMRSLSPVFVSYYSASSYPITITPQELKTSFRNSHLKILIVPGHDNENPGTAYGSLRETDLTLAIAEHLFNYLKSNKRFSVSTTRRFENGEYTPELTTYLNEHKTAIESFRDQSKQVTAHMIKSGQLRRSAGLERNSANEATSLRLYGINLWANERDIDLIIHIHINDVPPDVPRNYHGFTIYVPDHEYGNSIPSFQIAAMIFDQLERHISPSTLAVERAGIIEDPELIALGSNGSLNAASLLIEYGFIYEPQFRTQTIRKLTTQELAFQTYQGIRSYFEPIDHEATTLIPYQWPNTVRVQKTAAPEVLALQAVLKKEASYPPSGKTLTDCPLSGIFGSCTKEALAIFQNRVGITPAEGVIGEKTLLFLNKHWGVQ